MKASQKRLIYVLAAVSVLAVLAFFLFQWKLSGKETEVFTSASPDGSRTLIVYQVGDPDWPFGATHCRACLLREDTCEQTVEFSIKDDGANARETNFSAAWGESEVLLTAMGTEQENAVYPLSFSESGK